MSSLVVLSVRIFLALTCFILRVILLLSFGLSWLADRWENWPKTCDQDEPELAGHLAEGSDEQTGDDGKKGAGDQLQEEAVEPDIELVQ